MVGSFHPRNDATATARRFLSRPRWLRYGTLGVAVLFAWTMVLATPIAALAQQLPGPRLGMRTLSATEMQHMIGQLVHDLSYSPASGPTYPWEGSADGVNTGNGNKTTSIPIVGWAQRGGLPVAFTLYHNSEGNHDSELGEKWTFSYDLYLIPTGTSPYFNQTIHWGNDLAYQFTNNGANVFSPPTGIYDTFVKNVDSTFTLTTKDQVAYHFNTSGYCDTISDENGNTVSIAHNSGNYVTTITDATSRVIALGYDSSNRINSITDPLSRNWTLAYDSSNELQTITYPVVTVSGTPTTYTTVFGYDSTHDITSLKSPAGNTSTFNYNSDYSLNWEKDAAGNETQFSYTSGTTCTITDPNGHTHIDTYSSSGLLTQQTDALSYSASYQYDANLDRKQVTDQRGYVWKYTFDGSGNLLTAEDPYSNVTTMTYNAHNKRLTTQDALGHTTSWSYDSHDNLLSVTDALSHAITYTVDTYGQRQTATDALTHETSYGYSTNGDCTSVTDANSNETTLTFDALGRCLSVEDPLTHTTSTTYDNWERPISVTTPAGTTTTVYDGDNNILTETNPNSHTDTLTYDVDDRLLTKQQANGDTINYYYDGDQPGGGSVTGQKGLLSAQKDGNGHVITWTYDADNRKLSVSYPDSTSESWSYDHAGNLASHIDEKSQTISYTYDNASRLITVTYPTGTGAGTGVSITYDVANRKTGMTDVTGTWGYSYDNANRFTQISAPNGTTGYGYDNANRRTSMTLTQGTTVSTWTYTFDNGNRLLTTVSPYSETTTTGYDVASRVTSVTNGNGTLTSYTYDNADRVTNVCHKQASGTILGQYAYTYDDAGNVLTRSDNDGSTTTFGYDAGDQLTSEVRTGTGAYSISYTYDHNSNRLSKTEGGVTDTYTYGSHDKLSSTSSKSYTYDLNGNCTSVTVAGGTTTLTYDIENRVIGISYPSGATNSFVYNGEDLRTQKVDSSGTKNYVTDGDAPASAVLTDGAAVYTPGLSERRSGASKFYHGDALGSTRGITNTSTPPVATDSILYDAFGMTVSRTGTTPTPFCFVGAEQYQSDSDSGLQLLGDRYYDPSTGRFLSQDPIQHGDNWYAYCDNNPLVSADPTGLDDTMTVVTTQSPNGNTIRAVVPTKPPASSPRTTANGTITITDPSQGISITGNNIGSAPDTVAVTITKNLFPGVNIVTGGTFGPKPPTYTTGLEMPYRGGPTQAGGGAGTIGIKSNGKGTTYTGGIMGGWGGGWGWGINGAIGAQPSVSGTLNFPIYGNTTGSFGLTESGGTTMVTFGLKYQIGKSSN